MKVRRVVTGHDAMGKSIFVSDVHVEPATVSVVPGAEFHQLWGGDTAPSFPGDGAMPPHTSYFPPVGGYRCGVFSLPPKGIAAAEPTPDELAAGLAELEAKLPGLAQYLEPNAPGMHTTPTLDFEVVISGEVTLELDDSATVVLRAGDTIVQNGTRHRWRNDGATRRDRATHTGTFEGIAATGRSISIGQLSMVRVMDGRIVEIREEADMLGLMQQIGAIPSSTTYTS